jgi:hypothetical protein
VYRFALTFLVRFALPFVQFVNVVTLHTFCTTVRLFRMVRMTSSAEDTSYLCKLSFYSPFALTFVRFADVSLAALHEWCPAIGGVYQSLHDLLCTVAR